MNHRPTKKQPITCCCLDVEDQEVIKKHGEGTYLINLRLFLMSCQVFHVLCVFFMLGIVVVWAQELVMDLNQFCLVGHAMLHLCNFQQVGIYKIFRGCSYVCLLIF